MAKCKTCGKSIKVNCTSRSGVYSNETVGGLCYIGYHGLTGS